MAFDQKGMRKALRESRQQEYPGRSLRAGRSNSCGMGRIHHPGGLWSVAVVVTPDLTSAFPRGLGSGDKCSTDAEF